MLACSAQAVGGNILRVSLQSGIFTDMNRVLYTLNILFHYSAIRASLSHFMSCRPTEQYIAGEV